MLFQSDIEVAVRKIRTFESRLKSEFGAKGNGFAEYVKSVQGKLSDETVQQLKQVNDIRNDIVHNEGRDRLPNRREFVELCDNVERSLDQITKPRLARQKIQLILMIVLFTISLAICMVFQGTAQ
jgi:hypothetical protein